MGLTCNIAMLSADKAHKLGINYASDMAEHHPEPLATMYQLPGKGHPGPEVKSLRKKLNCSFRASGGLIHILSQKFARNAKTILERDVLLVRARWKAERVLAEYEDFLSLSDPTRPTRPDPTVTLFSVLYLLNQAIDW